MGNRTALTRTGGPLIPALTTASYSYGASSHRLDSVTSSASRTLNYLASGQMSSDISGGVTKTYSYDAEGRMIAAYEGGVLQAAYDYDAYGQQVSKTEGGASIHLIHDPFGRLIAEHDGSTGATAREYIYLGLMPVAMIDHSSGTPTIYYIHTDQVAQPQKMTDATGTVVWGRIATPFGVEVMATGSLTNAQRFPGQLEDLETSLFQNWNRDYDPLLGRYVQSDPIGLLGGINTYAYVAGSPLRRIDSTGLQDGPGVERRADAAAQFGLEFGSGTVLMEKNRDDMLTANTIGGDKYFHCKANCEATQVGTGGYAAAYFGSVFRELRQGGADIANGNYTPGDAAADMVANSHGRSEALRCPAKDCKKLCQPFRPRGLPNRY